MELAIIIGLCVLAALVYFAVTAKKENKDNANRNGELLVDNKAASERAAKAQAIKSVQNHGMQETAILIEDEAKPDFTDPEPPVKGSVEAKLLAIRKVPIIPQRPINKESLSILRIIEEEASRGSNNTRVLSKVGMASFLKANHEEDKSANKEAYYTFVAKSVDFLVIDSSGNPCFVVEYHGSGHFLGDDAPERDLIKREVLRHAGIDLVEIHKQMGQDERKALIAGAVHRMTILK